MTNTTTDDLAQRLRDWSERNPMRLWRREHDITLMRMSLLTDVGITTLQYYESGARRPKGASLEKIAGAMSVEAAVLDRRWTNWSGRQPRP